jgi:hypothetical protein
LGKAFADRWGAPVRSGSAEAVALLDEAIEDLAALAGDPVADAEAAVAADDSLARALVAERVARKPSAEASARQLVAENGGSPDALRW